MAQQPTNILDTLLSNPGVQVAAQGMGIPLLELNAARHQIGALTEQAQETSILGSLGRFILPAVIVPYVLFEKITPVRQFLLDFIDNKVPQLFDAPFIGEYLSKHKKNTPIAFSKLQKELGEGGIFSASDKLAEFVNAYGDDRTNERHSYLTRLVSSFDQYTKNGAPSQKAELEKVSDLQTYSVDNARAFVNLIQQWQGNSQIGIITEFAKFIEDGHDPESTVAIAKKSLRFVSKDETRDMILAACNGVTPEAGTQGVPTKLREALEKVLKAVNEAGMAGMFATEASQALAHEALQTETVANKPIQASFDLSAPTNFLGSIKKALMADVKPEDALGQISTIAGQEGVDPIVRQIAERVMGFANAVKNSDPDQQTQVLNAWFKETKIKGLMVQELSVGLVDTCRDLTRGRLNSALDKQITGHIVESVGGKSPIFGLDNILHSPPATEAYLAANWLRAVKRPNGEATALVVLK